MAVNTTIAGRRFGYLVTAYTDERAHKISCRCICSRLVHVAIEDLRDGIVTSCGCKPAPAAFWIRVSELRAQARREAEFRIAAQGPAGC